jgi:hypothetical protein
MASSDSLNRLLTRLEESKRLFGPRDGAQVEKLLAALGRRRFKEAAPLVRFHEALLFLRAYPQNAKVLRRTEELLASFAERVERLRATELDLSPLEGPEVSGIAGTEFSGTLSYDVVRRLSELHPQELDIDWENYEISDRLAITWRRLFPLLEDDSLVEAHVPYLEWLRAGMGRKGSTLHWIVRRLERLPLDKKSRAELYDALEFPVRWDLRNSRVTRTRTKLPVREVFYHKGSLLKRSDVQLASELASPSLTLKRLTPAEGERILDITRETSAVRYRELYGFTYGDPRHAYKTALGRGVEVFLFGVPPERRLPLRAYHAAMMFKNGVPVGYFETLSLFERLEVGFNLYYTFREGETAWLFGRLLRLFHQVLGVTRYSIDPYQIGHENEEAIESGAFWFYRKLGFRPVLPKVAALADAEEKKIREIPGYRTPLKTLRRLAVGYMIYEMPGLKQGEWDRFHVRNLGLAVQRRMAQRYQGDAAAIRSASVASVARSLGVSPDKGTAFENLALVLDLIPSLARWPESEKAAVVRIIRAKTAPEESRYVRLLGSHHRLREAVLALGSAKRPYAPVS